MNGMTYDVVIYEVRKQASKSRPYQVRWKVAGKVFPQSFATVGLAKSFRSDLTRAATKGEAFELETGLPVSLARSQNVQATTVTWLAHAREYSEYKWTRVAAKSRAGIAGSLRDVTLAVMPKRADAPSDAVLGKALRLFAFRPVTSEEGVPEEIQAALEWAGEHSPSLEAVCELSSMRRILDILSRTQNGQASANYFIRRRANLFNALQWAVTKKRIAVNPLAHTELEWDRPSDLQSSDVVDPRSVGNVEQVEQMLMAVSYVGRGQGPRFVAFFACMYYAMMRPEEVINLKEGQCELPNQGWGRLVLERAAPASGRSWTDTGEVHEERALKHRGRTATRVVPIQPRLVELLKEHIARFGTARDGRLFQTVRGNRIDIGTYTRVWKAAKASYGLSPSDVGTPRLRRPYDLRHSGVSLRRTAGVPSKQVAEWAGHSVEVLERIYSKVLEGYDDRWQRQIDSFMNG